MLDEGPSKLYDALSSVLGLDGLVAVEKLLADARRAREKAHKDAQASLQRLLPGLGQLDDDRARRCLGALVGKRWDTDAVESVLLGAAAGTEVAGELEVLRRLSSIQGPSVEGAMEAAERLREAAAAVAAAAGTDAERARSVAHILQRALDFHAGHGDGDCPVCGCRGALDPAWRAGAEAQVRELRVAAETAEATARRLKEAVRAARAQRGLEAVPARSRPPRTCATSASNQLPGRRSGSGSCSGSSRTWSLPGRSWREQAPAAGSSWT
jgi:hypothetical protein